MVEDGINKSVIDRFVIELSSSDSEVADDSDEETSGDEEPLPGTSANTRIINF